MPESNLIPLIILIIVPLVIINGLVLMLLAKLFKFPGFVFQKALFTSLVTCLTVILFFLIPIIMVSGNDAISDPKSWMALVLMISVLIISFILFSRQLKPSGFIKRIIIYIILLATMVTNIYLIRNNLLVIYYMDNDGMKPTINKGQYFLVTEYYKQLNRGDIVLFTTDDDSQGDMVSRIIGLPNEEVKIKDNVVTIYNTDNPQGIILNEQYIANRFKLSDGHVILNQGEYFMLIDSPVGSYGRYNQEDLYFSNLTIVPKENIFAKFWININ